MFTGLVETIGTIRAAAGSSPRRLTIASSIPAAEVAIGDSVAIDGCCQTVVARHGDALSFEAATETLSRTTLGGLRVGDEVHLERALQVGGRLGGHIVQGHVDGVGEVVVKERRESALYVGVAAPEEVAALTAPRGSITIAGVSLTVTDVKDDLIFVGLIPHTVGVTLLERLQKGDAVNLEADLFARYVANTLAAMAHRDGRGSPGGGSLTLDFLKDKGFA